jgi:hypothetical protein
LRNWNCNVGATCTTGTAQWYAAATGGASIATGASFTTPSISATTSYYVSCKTTEGCESGRTEVKATINPIPSAPTVKPAAICGTGTVTLGATCTTGVAQWYAAATGGASVSTGASFTTPSITATTSYYVSCKTTEGCESGRTPVAATVNPIPNAPTTKGDAICGTGTVTLGATCTTGVAQWYAAATGGSSVATGASFTTPSISATTNYYVSCKTTEGCESGRTPVVATVNPIPNAPTVTPAAICGTGTVTLGATCTTGVAQWYAAATGGSSVATGASFITPSISATTSYYVSCKTTEGCESGRTPVTATINPIPSAPTVKPAAICGTGTVTLGATCATGSTAMWYIAATGGASIATGASYTTPSISATTTYYVSCKTDAGCESGRTPVAATVNPIPNAPTVTPAAICGTGTVTLGAICTTGVAQWYAAATGGASVATGASFTTPSISKMVTYYVSCKTTEGCESIRTPVTATINEIPAVPTVKSAETCGSGSVILGATCMTGTAQWYAVATGGASIATGATFTTPNLTATTSYYVSCKSTEGCESARTEVKAVVIGKITDGGTIKADETICAGGTPAKITSVTPASGGDVTRAIEYIWLQTTSLSNGTCPLNVLGQNLYTEIPNSNTPDYQPGAITQTTCYIRCARRNGCTDYLGGESNAVKKTVTNPFTITASTNPNEVCVGTTVAVTVTTTSTDVITYSWSGPNGFTANTKDLSIANVALAANGVYTVTASNGGCSAVATVQVKVVYCLKIGDLVFNDKNNNGKQDAGESGIAGVTVKLFDSANNVVGTTTTDASGLYSFTNLPSGTYTVEITAPAGYKSSTGTNGSATGAYEPTTGSTNVNNEDNGTTVSGQTIRSKPVVLTTTDNTNVDFGLFKPAKLGDFVFRDTNEDGIQDAGEVGVAGVTVKLFDGANNLVATTTTDANGKYLFDNLAPGNYSVEFVKSTLPAGLVFSPQGATTGDKDSDADVTTGKTGTITLTEGQTNNDIDAGVKNSCTTTPPTAKPAAICGTGTVNLGATCTTGTAQWYAAATGGSSIATGASYTTPSLSATTTYYVSCKSSVSCESGRTPVAATVNANATAPTVTPAAICGTGTVTLGATCATGSVANWYAAATGGVSVATGASFTTPSISATTSYYVSCKTDAGCESARTEVKATVNAAPAAPTVKPAAICGIGTVTLGATCATGTAQWYVAATGGSSIATGASYTTPSLSATTTYYVSCKTDAGCESGRTPVAATVNTNPAAPTVTPAAICGTGTVTLGATCATGSVANWYAAATGGASVATGASFTIASISATTSYYVSCKTDAGCESARTEVKATVNAAPAAPTVTPAAICGTGTVTLGATCATGSVANWYVAATGGASIATGASFTTPSISATTTYYVSCKSDAGCESGRMPVAATINAGGTAPTVTPATTCGAGTLTLGANCSSGTAQWYAAATGGSAIATGASFTTPSLSTTTSYYVSCKSAQGCESARTEVKATVIGKITDGGTIKADETICAGTSPSKIVNVTLPTGGDASLAIEYIWLQTTSLDANGACPVNVVGQNLYTEIPGSITPDYQPGAITQTTCYVRCARRKGCTDYIGGESNYVKKTVTSPFTIAASTNPNAVCNGTTVTVTTTTTATGAITYSWAGPNGFTANTKDLSIANVTLAANGVYTVSASNGGGCSAVATVHVKVVSCLKIGDLVFNDKNNNGKQDAGESGIAGVTVKLFDSANNQVGSSTTTDANGLYSFTNLPAGTYTVEITAPATYKSSTGTNGSATGAYEPTTGSANINGEDNGTTVSGQIIRSKPVVLTTTDNTNVDFGLFKPAKIGDYVFRDSNGDGKQDAGEAGVAGVTVKLYDSANNVVATTTTDANGKYVFDNLIAGNYTVEFVKSTLPSGLGFSPQGATTGDKDSDANVTTGKTATITLTEGQINNDIDAGLTGPCDKDVTPPVLSACPYDVLIKTRGTTATVSWTAPTATDNCGTPVVTSTNAPGSQFPVGATTVTYTATDSKGNKTTCSFVVNVVKIITCDTDTQAPVFYDCPTDINLTTTGTGATALWDHPSVGDNCGIPSVVFNYSPGQNFPVGVTTVIYTAKDAKGNTSYCMFKVTVVKQTVTGGRIAAAEEAPVSVEEQISLYPNPTASDFAVELSAELMKANSSVEVSVISMTGNVQFTETAKGTERVSVKIPVQNMPNGTYFVNVGLDNGRMIIKKLQIVK